MLSSSVPTVLNLTLDLNSQAHAPPAGVLKTLNLVADAPREFNLHLRVMHGTSVLMFSFTGLEEISRNARSVVPDLGGSTLTPETYRQDSVEPDPLEVNGHLTSSLNSEDAESVDSDEPLCPTRGRRHRPLHHKAVRDDSYEDTESEDNIDEKVNKHHGLRRTRPAPGAMAEPPEDACDILEFNEGYSGERNTNQSRKNSARARPQQNPPDYQYKPERRSRMTRIPDLYMEVDGNNNLEGILTQDKARPKRPRRTKRSNFLKGISYATQ